MHMRHFGGRECWDAGAERRILELVRDTNPLITRSGPSTTGPARRIWVYV